MSIYTVHDLPDNIPKDFSAFTSEDDMLTITKPLRERFGITYFVHCIYFADGRMTALLTHSEVAIHWIVNKYFLPGNDHQGGFFPSGFYFVPYLGKLFPESLKESLAKLFDIDHMLMIVDSNKLYSEVFVFGAEVDNFKIVNFYFNNLNLLQNFIIFYKEKAKNLIRKAMDQKKIIMPAAPKIIMNSQEVKNFTGNSLKFLKINEKIYLTEQEVECIQLISRGKTAKEAAKIMNISPRTVEYHLGVSKEKLDCRLKSELIEKFIKIRDRNIWF